MGKLVDITNKLAFDENPKLKVGETILEVNASAMNVLKIMALIEDSEEGTNASMIEEMSKLLFVNVDDFIALNLSMEDYQLVISSAQELVVGGDLDDTESKGE